MKVRLTKDEWYPVYMVFEPLGDYESAEIPDELKSRYDAALEEFEVVQDELEKFYNR